MQYLLLPMLSFVVGILVGLTGVGGASLVTPMLIFVFNVPASIAISSDVVAATPMKVVGGFKHWKQQTVDMEIVKWLAIGSVPGALTGVGTLHLIRDVGGGSLDDMLYRLLGTVMLAIALSAFGQLSLKLFFPAWELPELPKFDLETNVGRVFALTIGAILGWMMGMTSVGTGSLFALVLIAFFRLDSQKLVGTDIAQAAILLLFTAFGHLTLGTVNWGLVLPIWLGTVPGVLFGAFLCKKAPQSLLRLLIYVILMMIGWKLVNYA